MELLQVLADHVHERIVQHSNRLGRLHGLLARNKLHTALGDVQQRLAFTELRHAVDHLARLVVHAATAIERVDVLAGIFRTDGTHIDDGLLVFLHEIRAELVDILFLEDREFLIIGDDLEIVVPAVHAAIDIVVVHAFVEHGARTHEYLDALRKFFEHHVRIAFLDLEPDFILHRAQPKIIPRHRILREKHDIGTGLLGASDRSLHLLDILFRFSRSNFHLD